MDKDIQNLWNASGAYRAEEKRALLMLKYVPTVCGLNLFSAKKQVKNLFPAVSSQVHTRGTFHYNHLSVLCTSSESSCRLVCVCVRVYNMICTCTCVYWFLRYYVAPP